MTQDTNQIKPSYLQPDVRRVWTLWRMLRALEEKYPEARQTPESWGPWTLDWGSLTLRTSEGLHYELRSITGPVQMLTAIHYVRAIGYKPDAPPETQTERLAGFVDALFTLVAIDPLGGENQDPLKIMEERIWSGVRVLELLQDLRQPKVARGEPHAD